MHVYQSDLFRGASVVLISTSHAQPIVIGSDTRAQAPIVHGVRHPWFPRVGRHAGFPSSIPTSSAPVCSLIPQSSRCFVAADLLRPMKPPPGPDTASLELPVTL